MPRAKLIDPPRTVGSLYAGETAKRQHKFTIEASLLPAVFSNSFLLERVRYFKNVWLKLISVCDDNTLKDKHLFVTSPQINSNATLSPNRFCRFFIGFVLVRNDGLS